ncbi:hypothetical protein CCP2SC5_480008 [Azospirillaceae bacterium]
MQTTISSAGIAALIEQTSRLVHSSGYAEGLYPAQWTALRFFADAPPSGKTTAALARFQGMSLGPVARTVRTLVDKELLARSPNPANKRADIISVTPSGMALLQRDPRSVMSEALGRLPDDQQVALATALEVLLVSLLEKNRRRSKAEERREAARGMRADFDAQEHVVAL